MCSAGRLDAISDWNSYYGSIKEGASDVNVLRGIPNIFSNLIPEDWNNCEMGFFAGIFPVQLQSPPNPYPFPFGLHVPTT